MHLQLFDFFPMSFVLATGLAEAVVEFTLYGAFTVVFSAVVYLFWIRGLISRKRPSLFVFVALVFLFLSITAVRNVASCTIPD